MLDIVLVHGAFHGGWCWAETAQELRRYGARVFTPTLTGLADKKHLFSPSINLATHVRDIVNLIEFEALDGCILAGHSYAGNVLTGVGDLLRDRVSHYIFVDASVPEDGTTSWGWCSLNPQRHSQMLERIHQQGYGMMVPPFPAQAFGITDSLQVKRIESLLTPMPLGCYLDKIELLNGGTEGLRRSYLAAANPPYERMAGVVERLSGDPAWTFRDIDTGHDMMVTKPVRTAEILWELATGSLNE